MEQYILIIVIGLIIGFAYTKFYEWQLRIIENKRIRFHKDLDSGKIDVFEPTFFERIKYKILKYY